jgi:hypothetical protein
MMSVEEAYLYRSRRRKATTMNSVRTPIVVHESTEKRPFDRAEHCRRIAQSGGFVTSMRYGDAHMSRIGKVGYAVTKAKLGEAQTQALIRGKGWTRPQVSSFREDMERVGR